MNHHWAIYIFIFVRWTWAPEALEAVDCPFDLSHIKRAVCWVYIKNCKTGSWYFAKGSGTTVVVMLGYTWTNRIFGLCQWWCSIVIGWDRRWILMLCLCWGTHSRFSYWCVWGLCVSEPENRKGRMKLGMKPHENLLWVKIKSLSLF